MEDLGTYEENKRQSFIENMVNFLGRTRARGATLEKLKILVYFKGKKTAIGIARSIIQDIMRMKYITEEKMQHLADMIDFEMRRVREYEMKRKELRKIK